MHCCDVILYVRLTNEFYARDTSRKIKSVFKAKGMSGKHLTGTVIYGYLWDEKRENWIVDDEAAAVVRRIFAMSLAGYGPYQIATRLTQDKVEIPSVHLARFNEGVNRTKPVKDIYGWGSSTIVHILKKREFNFISAMVYTQMFNVLCDKALENGGALKTHVTCLLDEFANQKIPNFQHLISVIRSREISAHIVVQTQSQLKAVYKDHAETIIGNCSCVLFLGGKERSTLKEISETLGKETIDLFNTSDTRGSQRSICGLFTHE